MSVDLSIKGQAFEYPTNKDEQWGTNATDWAIAVTDALDGLTNSGDLPPLSVAFNIQNNQSTPTNIVGLSFDPAEVRSAELQYFVYRTRGATEYSESGTICVRYKSTAGVWTLDREYGGDEAGVTFTITNGGQIQYTSTEIATSGTYIGNMNFRAKALLI